MASRDNVPPKRQRTTQACLPCRNRKSKCDGGEPQCLICVNANRECVYADKKRKRGLPGGYVRSLENALGLMMMRIPNSEHALRSLIRSRNDAGDAIFVTAMRESVSTWHSSLLAKDLEQLLDTADDYYIVDPGILPHIDPVASSDDSLSFISSEQSARNEMTLPQRTSHQRPGLPYDISTHQRSSEPPLPLHAAEMVEWYFTYTHCCFPIVDRLDILRVLYSDQRAEQRNSAEDGYRKTLWAIIAYTVVQRRESTQEPAHEVNVNQTTRLLASGIGIDEGSFELGHIQATLILALLHMGRVQLREAWTLVAKASRMLCIYQATIPQQASRYPHTLRGCFLLENVIAALLGMLPSGHLKKLLANSTLDQHTLDEWSPWNAKLPNNDRPTGLTFNHPMRSISTFDKAFELSLRLFDIMSLDKDQLQYNDLLGDLVAWKERVQEAGGFPKMDHSDPPSLNLRLLWHFVVLVVFKTKLEGPDVSVTLFEHYISSTRELIQQNLKLTGISGSTPFLIGYALQESQITESLAFGPSMSGVQESVIGRLKRHWLSTPDTSESALSPSQAHQRIKPGSNTIDSLHGTYRDPTDCEPERTSTREEVLRGVLHGASDMNLGPTTGMLDCVHVSQNINNFEQSPSKPSDFIPDKDLTLETFDPLLEDMAFSDHRHVTPLMWLGKE